MRGTLDLLILRSLLAAPLHGLGIARRIAQLTHGSFDVKAGSLFPALYRLEERGLVSAEWGESDTRRRAKFYRLTRLGKKQLQLEEANWRRIALAMAHALGPVSGSRAARFCPGCAHGFSMRCAAALAMPISAPTSRRSLTCSPMKRWPPVCRPTPRAGRPCWSVEAS